MKSANIADYPVLFASSYVDALLAAIAYLETPSTVSNKSIFHRTAITIAIRVLSLEVIRLNSIGA